jgi:hypothetical protein
MSYGNISSTARRACFIALSGLLALAVFLMLAKPASADNHYQPGDLIKGSQSTVYYYSDDGKRYVFPNVNTYRTWYTDFGAIKRLSDEELAGIPLGGNVTYKPGSRMIKAKSSPKVYAVDKGGVLRWVKSERVAEELYGENWKLFIDDLADAFFTNYQIGDPVEGRDVFDPTDKQVETPKIDADLEARLSARGQSSKLADPAADESDDASTSDTEGTEGDDFTARDQSEVDTEDSDDAQTDEQTDTGGEDTAGDAQEAQDDDTQSENGQDDDQEEGGSASETDTGSDTETQDETESEPEDPTPGVVYDFLDCPSAAERKALRQDFELDFFDVRKDPREGFSETMWDKYPYECDWDSEEPSRLAVYNTLALLKDIQFSKPLPFTGGDTIYEFLTLSTVPDEEKPENEKLTIVPMLECDDYRNSFAGNFTVHANPTLSFLYPTLSGTCNNSLPDDGDYSRQYLLDDFVYNPLYKADLIVREGYGAINENYFVNGWQDAETGTLSPLAVQFYFNAWVNLYATNVDADTRQHAGQSAQFALDRFGEDKCPSDKEMRSVVNQIEPGRCE